MTTTEPTTPGPAAHVELDITGMTCASCAARIEKKLNKLEGVHASVNYATERASVSFDVDRVDTDRLVQVVRDAGYDASVPRRAADATVAAGSGGDPAAGLPVEMPADPELDELRHRLFVSTVLALPVIVLSMVPAWQFENWQWLALTLAAPVAVWGAWPLHRAAWTNARHGTATMDTLVSIGVWAAFGWSLYALFFGEAGHAGMTMPFTWRVEPGMGAHEIYLEVATAVPIFILGGRYFEKRAKRRGRDALTALLDLGAREVTVLDDAPAEGGAAAERTIPVAALHVGMRFAVRPGEKVATDGVIERGSSAIDASMITGESVPVEVGPGDPVIGATVNVGGYLVVRATRVGGDTALAQMARLVEEAQSGKAPVQRLADRVSMVFVPAVLVIALGTLVWWLATGGTTVEAFTAAVAVLIIACPCALGLATPTALLVGTGRGAQMGIVIRGPEVLESTRRVDTVVLDKTGTVTTGRMALLDVHVADGVDADEALRLVGGLEAASEHPIARAIAHAASARGPVPAVEGFASRVGLGVEGVVDGHAVVAGRPSLMADWSLQVPASLADAMREAEEQGRTAVVAAWDGSVRAVLVVADSVKPTSADAIVRLRDLGLRPVLLTGDNARTARAVAAAVGIDDVHAEVLPARKVEVVKELQAAGRVVAMVGDGVNDAAALAQADLGVAMGTGTDVAMEASDLTLVSGDLRAAADAIRLSRRTLRTIKANLFWAFAYNVAAIPLAASGRLNPLVAGAAMALSSVFVVSNSLRLRRFRSLDG
jgi:Cu+-exporting ATPase